MATDPDKTGTMKAFFVISALYLPFLLLLSWISGHLHQLGDASLFFSSTDSQGYKLIADYYMSLGNSEKPSDYLLALRPFMFPLYLGLYHLIGIAGMQVLQMMINATSLWLIFVAIQALSNRKWIAGVCTTLLAITPSFNFLVFHALTESLSIFLVCVFTALIVDHFQNHRQTSLLLATLVVSTLLCIRPIVQPFWILLVAYYLIWSLRERMWSLWRPVVSISPVLIQFMLSFMLTGSGTFSPTGSVVISSWYFPVVYGEKEYGRFMGRKSKETEEGMKRFPKLEDKLQYIIKNRREAIHAYSSILIGDNLIAGSNFVRPPGQSDDRHKTVHAFLLNWSVYLNRLFVCIHTIMVPLLIWLLVSGRREFKEKAMLACYIFAVLLVLPSGLAYFQGDRYILLAEPLWLVGHSALVGLFIDFLENHGEAKSRGGGLLHRSATTRVQ